MESRYLTIGIKDKDIEQVKQLMNSSSFYEESIKVFELAGVNVSIQDLREDFINMTKFLKQNGLQDDNPFFNYFDIDAYGLTIDFNMNRKFEQTDVLEPIVFLLGKYLSELLKTECIVMFDNMRMPVGLFKEGKLHQTFEAYNDDFFNKRIWKPNKI